MKLCADLNEGKTVYNLEDWKNKCLNDKQKNDHWVDGRSMKEFAKLWFDGDKVAVPKALVDLLENNRIFSAGKLLKGSPEVETEFDERGKGRNHDMVIVAENAVICIEAKVDEPFGEIVADELGKSTNKNERIKELISAIFQYENNDEIQNVRYQLLHGIAGTIAEADLQFGTDLKPALFLIWNIKTSSIDTDKAKTNDDDLNRFIDLFTQGEYKKIADGQIIGPFTVPGNEYISSSRPVYIGKLRQKVV